MKKFKSKIDFPTDEEMDKHIHKIVDVGLPEQKSFFERLLLMYRQIGFSHLFKDKTEIFFLIFIGLSIICFLSLSLTHNQFAENVYMFLFTVSPCIYFLLAIRSFVHKFNREAEIEHTTKYSFTQLSAFRMLLFSIISLLLNTVVIALISLFIAEVSLLRAFLIMSCSLFIFSVLFLYNFQHTSVSWMQTWGVGALWVFGNLLLFTLHPNGVKALLLQIPMIVYFAISVIGLILFYIAAKSLFEMNIKKEVS